ncbi:MAG TPA: sulfotransferase domain-containing protein [Magnetospirillaceae bacterium]|nr:sulfotransferase domain-containing protein [Magnetospirillaceae bacterium]
MGIIDHNRSEIGNSLASRPRDSIVYIASYPRSGNTFARILLAAYHGISDLNRLEESIPADTTESLWRGVPNYAAQEISARNNWRYRRQVIEDYRRRASPLPFHGLKTHSANLTAFGAPAFDLRPEDRILYLARHPLDVALSNADYNNQDLDSAIDLMCRPGTCVGGSTLGSVEARGSWPEHVAGWLLTTACPVLLVRYEDLCADTANMLRRILAFIGLPVEEDRIACAVEQSGFSTLQRRERESGFTEAPANTRSGRFFREGRSNQWRTGMSREQIARLSDYCAETMARLGYPDPRQEF